MAWDSFEGGAGCLNRVCVFFFSPQASWRPVHFPFIYNRLKDRDRVRNLRKTVQRENIRAVVPRENGDSDSEGVGAVGEEVYWEKEPRRIRTVSCSMWARKGCMWIATVLRGGRGVGLRYRSMGWISLGFWIGVRVAAPRTMDVTRQAVSDSH